MGRWCTLIGVLVSVGTAYLVQHSASIMDYAMQLFSFFIAPLFGTVILGMLWKRATNQGGFWGLLAGTLTSIGLWVWVVKDPSALRYVALSPDAKEMAENMYRALWAWMVCVGVTVAGEPANKAAERARTGRTGHGGHYATNERTNAIGTRNQYSGEGVVAAVFVVLNIALW